MHVHLPDVGSKDKIISRYQESSVCNKDQGHSTVKCSRLHYDLMNLPECRLKRLYAERTKVIFNYSVIQHVQACVFAWTHKRCLPISTPYDSTQIDAFSPLLFTFSNKQWSYSKTGIDRRNKRQCAFETTLRPSLEPAVKEQILQSQIVA